MAAQVPGYIALRTLNDRHSLAVDPDEVRLVRDLYALNLRNRYYFSRRHALFKRRRGGLEARNDLDSFAVVAQISVVDVRIIGGY